jgi:hypothetical protein
MEETGQERIFHDKAPIYDELYQKYSIKYLFMLAGTKYLGSLEW